MSARFFLPLLTYPEMTPPGGLLRAVDFTATLGGHLSAVTHVTDIPPIVNAFGPILIDYPELAEAAEAASQARAEDLEDQLKQAAHRFGLRLDIKSMVVSGPDGDGVARAARPADYTVFPMDPSSPAHRAVAEALLFGAGGPVVLFPANDAPTHIQSVVIAWDGSRAAARAVRDAVPILKRSREVTIVTANTDKPIAAGGVVSLLDFLAGHHVKAVHQEIAVGGRSIGDALQQKAIDEDAGLLVMGAYGHNRIREFVLGGATREILASLRLPTLMSH